MISFENMTRLIEAVNKVQRTGTITVNCLWGRGRSATFGISRDMYNEAYKAEKAGKNWFLLKGNGGKDPIHLYVRGKRTIRHTIVDSGTQDVFLHRYAEHLSEVLHGTSDRQQAA